MSNAGKNQSVRSLIWKGIVGATTVIGGTVLFLNLSEVPEWIVKWESIFQDMTEQQARMVLYLVAGTVVLAGQMPWVLELISRRKRRGNRPRLAIEYDEKKHFDKANQTISFDVRAFSEQHDRVQQVHVYLEYLTAKSKKTHKHQLAVQFTGHELAPMREGRGFRLDGEQPKTIKLVWTTPSDINIYFSGYTIDGHLRKEGFDTVKARYEVGVIVTSRNAETGRARFQIGCRKDGTLTFKKIVD